MIDLLDKTRRLLWLFVEFAFLLVLASMLAYLILGPNSGVFIAQVADNVLKFANALPPQSLVGMAIVLALILLISNRMK
jgi:hypothetical protein